MAASEKVKGRRDTGKRPTRPGQRGVVPDDIEIDLPSRSHMEGCPEEDNPESLDFWTAVPKSGNNAGQEVVFIRCTKCGGERAITLEALRDEQSE